jgi:hypothetical protein
MLLAEWRIQKIATVRLRSNDNILYLKWVQLDIKVFPLSAKRQMWLLAGFRRGVLGQ